MSETTIHDIKVEYYIETQRMRFGSALHIAIRFNITNQEDGFIVIDCPRSGLAETDKR